jgi:hypothetical protein
VFCVCVCVCVLCVLCVRVHEDKVPWIITASKSGAIKHGRERRRHEQKG